MHREVRRSAWVSGGVWAVVFVVLFSLAPLLDVTPFWQEHFPDESSRTGILVFAPLWLAGVLARAWRPVGWEGEIFSRGARMLAFAGLFWWALVPLLEAPRLAALVVFPFLLSVPMTLVQVARSVDLGPGPARRLLLASSLGSGFFGLGLAVVMWTHLPVWGFVLLAVPLAVLHVGLPVAAVATARRRLLQDAEGSAAAAAGASGGLALALPEGTLRPPSGHLALVVSVTALLAVLLIVAPGLPLTAPVVWIALVVALPLVVRAVLARRGVVHPRALAGPAWMRRHESRISLITDERLHRLDDAAHRFLRWGRGRRGLAREIAGVLGAADPLATPDRIEARLARLPRAPWDRRLREDGLVRLLREGGLDEGVVR